MSVRHLIITPGLHARCLLQHITRTCNQARLVHKLSSHPLVNGSANGQPNEDASHTASGRIQVVVVVGAIISVGAFGIYVKKKGLLLSSVQAAVPVNRSSNRDEFNFFADIVEQCAPAVVYIKIIDKRHGNGELATASNGSGFIIDPAGLILTNAHVVINKPHTSVVVQLHDGRTFDAHVEEVDDKSSLASVRIECEDLPALKLGTSSELRAGEWVVALGSPAASKNTVTAGIVSAVHRPSKVIGVRGNINYIQTDAAITAGSSGGPLINLDGEAIGINGMELVTGISFAIPIDYVNELMEKCRQKRARRQAQIMPPRRYMGITMVTLAKELLSELRQCTSSISMDVDHGVLVWKVIIKSPAFFAGLRPGDIITHINGEKVKATSDVYAHLSGNQKKLHITVHRGKRELKLCVTPDSAVNR